MKTTGSYLLAITVFGALCAAFSPCAQAQSIESMPAVVVKTVPLAGAENVTPGIVEIKVTFSKAMATNSCSWAYAWEHSTPEALGKPHYEADGRTCVLKAKLEPNKTYGYWLNTKSANNFRDANGQPAVPYLLVFKTKDK
jgi:hypothetical protein